MKTGHLFGIGVILLLACQAAGCEVTSEKLNIWKQSTKGAAKIRAALRDTGQSMAIRIEAAEALAEMDLAQPLAKDLQEISVADRKTISEELARSLVKKMKGPNPKETTRVQLQAKDALFAIRDLLEPAQRQEVDKEVVRWLLADFEQRDQGNHSAEKIIETIGRPGAMVLAENIDSEGAPAVVIAALLRQYGTDEAREVAGKKLVALASQQDPPPMESFKALGQVGSVAALSFLEGIVRKTTLELDLRVYGILAIALYPRPEMLTLARDIASDESLKGEDALLREHAFTLLEKINDPKSLQVLLTFFENKDEKVRFRALEAAVAGSREAGLPKVLEALSTAYPIKKEDLEDLVEKDIIALGNGILPPLRQALTSKNWMARLVSVRILGKVGSKNDAALLEPLTGDGTKIKGWPTEATIGQEAKAAIEALKSRL